MAVDTPARIAVLGAGPIGIEAALYARFLGYDVVVFERDGIASQVARWGHISMISQFGRSRSPLGLAALKCQDAGYRAPDDDRYLTGRQWIDEYFAPLCQTDLLADHVRLGQTVVAVGRGQCSKPNGSEGTRTEDDFWILLHEPDGSRSWETADVVIDATGQCGSPAGAGPGGLPAIGEAELAGQLEYRTPDLAGAARSQYAGKRVLLYGIDQWAAHTVSQLVALQREAPATQVTWVGNRLSDNPSGPILTIPDDPSSRRQELILAANCRATGPSPAFTFQDRSGIRHMACDPDNGVYDVEFIGSPTLESTGSQDHFDQVIINAGWRPDHRLTREMLVRFDARTERPVTPPVADCSWVDDDRAPGAILLSDEPDFYILGAKRHGRLAGFLFQQGLAQIRDLFALIGGRTNLDLYAGSAPQ